MELSLEILHEFMQHVMRIYIKVHDNNKTYLFGANSLRYIK
jgi:hypothetical protein